MTGSHVWSDLFLCEVVDEATGEPVPEGTVGSLVITPLFNNNVTPFLRWSSGDLVSITRPAGGDRPWSIFPVMRHARRTVGFFKVRGVNINHSELEDLMFFNQGITDFKAEVCNAESGLDVLHLFVEPKQRRRCRHVAAGRPRATCSNHSRWRRRLCSWIAAPSARNSKPASRPPASWIAEADGGSRRRNSRNDMDLGTAAETLLHLIFPPHPQC